MKGHLRQRGQNGTWYAVIDELDAGTGRRRRRWINLHTRSKRAAEDQLAQLLTQQQQGILPPANSETLKEYLSRWLRDVAAMRVRPTTLVSYRTNVEYHLIPALGHHKLVELRPGHIQSYYARALQQPKGPKRDGVLAPRTVQYVHAVLRRALEHAVKQGLIPRNPAALVEPPRPSKPQVRAWTPQDSARFLAAAEDDPWYALYVLAMTLQVRQALVYIHKQGLQFVDTKTHRSQRMIELTRRTVEFLKNHRAEQARTRLLCGERWQDHDLVFPNAFGRPVSPATVDVRFRKLLVQAGISRIRFHDLRHTHASALLAAGVNPKVVQERLGHSTIGITLDIYSHVIPGLQRQAAEQLEAALKLPPSRRGQDAPARSKR